MCLYTTTKKPKIAKKDITVYKVVVKYHINIASSSEMWSGPYYDQTLFEFDKLLSESLHNNHIVQLNYRTRHKHVYAIGEGYFHSYALITDAKKLCSQLLLEQVYCSTLGLDGAKDFNTIMVCRCTIPKGTLYYSTNHAYASKKIIVHKPKV